MFIYIVFVTAQPGTAGKHASTHDSIDQYLNCHLKPKTIIISLNDSIWNPSRWKRYLIKRNETALLN